MEYIFKELTNKEQWNKFVDSYPVLDNGVSKVTFTQSPNWGDFYESLGFKVIRIGIFKYGEIKGVFLGIVINAKRGKYLYIRNGPLLDWSDKKLVKQTVDFLKKWGKENNRWFIRISPLIVKDSLEDKTISKLNFPKFQMNDVEALDTWIMPLDKSENEILMSINKKTRYYINRAQKMGASAFITNDSKYIDDFYSIYLDTIDRKKWNGYSKDYILKEFTSFAKDNNAHIILIKFQEKYISGGIFLHYGSQSFYHYGASLSEYSNVAGQYLTIWEALKLSKSLGKTYFNFWGISTSNNPKHPWAGLTKFKKKFPGFEQKWSAAKDIPISKLYWLTHFYDMLDKYKKGY